MTTLILARHGRTAANVSGVLAGRSAGVDVDDEGRRQAEVARDRLADVPLVAAFSSPLTRCRSTARILVAGSGVHVRADSRLNECDYGDWTGKKLKALVKQPLWPVIQSQPAAVTFPGGESLRAMSARAVGAARDRDREVAEEHGAGAIWLAVSHGDVIKAILADALGMHLDQFQRIVVDPGSLSVVRYDAHRAHVLTMNSSAGSLAGLAAQREHPDRKVGGGAGTLTRTP